MVALEYDPVHAATHLFNFSGCEVVCRDARYVTGPEIEQVARQRWEAAYPSLEWPGIDVVIGGPPCQGFSTGGKRNHSDERNHLVLEFVRLVEEIRPKAFCMENVAGFLEARHSEVRQVAIRRLQEAGYLISGADSTVNVRDYGVPQSRKRVVLLGAKDEAPSMPSPRGGRVSVAEALEGLPDIEDYPELLVSDSVQLRPGDLSRLENPMSEFARAMVSKRAPAPRDWDRSILTGARRTVHTQATVDRFSKTATGSVEPKSRLFRLDPIGQSRTLRAGSGSERGSHTSPRPIHPTKDRAITARESARLQSYPDWFRFHTTNWHAHRQIGNSVPPLLAEAAATALLKALGHEALPPLELIQGDVKLLSMNRSQAAELLGADPHEMPAARRRGSISQSEGTTKSG